MIYTHGETILRANRPLGRRARRQVVQGKRLALVCRAAEAKPLISHNAAERAFSRRLSDNIGRQTALKPRAATIAETRKPWFSRRIWRFATERVRAHARRYK